MSIYSLLRKLENKLNEWIAVKESENNVPETKSVNSDTRISDALCTQNLKNEDTYEVNNVGKNTKISEAEIKANKDNIKKEFGISWWNSFLYDIANFFDGSYSIMEGVEKYIDDSTSLEDAIDKLVAEEYDGLKNDKDYKKYRKRYGLGLLNLDPKNMKEADCMAASIAKFKVEDRVNVFRSLMGMGQTVSEKSNLARLGQSHALSIVTKNDPISGKAPDSKFAFDFQRLAYENMDKAGIVASNFERDKKAGEILKIHQKINNGEELSADEQIFLDKYGDVNTIYNNYVISGYSGALAGITGNMILSNAEAQVFMSSISETVQHYGIQNEVFNQVDEYFANNPNSAIESRVFALAEIKTQAMQAAQQQDQNVNQVNASEISISPRNTSQQNSYTPENASGNSQAVTVTNPVTNNSASTTVSPANSNSSSSAATTASASTSYVTNSITANKDLERKPIQKSEKKSAPSVIEKQKALLSPETYQEYMKEYDIGKIQACKDILNDATDNRLIAYGLELFKTVLSEADREDLVSNSNGLDDKGKARVAKVCSLHIMNMIKVNDVWAQEQIAATKKERMEKLGIKDDCVEERNIA